MNYHVNKLQAQNWINFKVKFDLEGQGRLPPQNNWGINQGVCTFGPNLVILARMDPKLLCGQTKGRRTHRWMDGHTHTDAGNNNTWRPKLAFDKNDKLIHYVKTWVQKKNMYMDPAVQI